jgi:8-oxo-dGTP pyrophosphatase MutT (NUDIX family)
MEPLFFQFINTDFTTPAMIVRSELKTYRKVTFLMVLSSVWSCPNYSIMKPVENRQSARLICINADNQVLLFQYSQWSGGTFWATPGGGVEDGESFEEAAIREAAEELGAAVTIVRTLGDRLVDIPHRERTVHQLERYFQVKLEYVDPAADLSSEHRREGILQSRWWTLDEILSTTETVFPELLVKWLSEIQGY